MIVNRDGEVPAEVKESLILAKKGYYKMVARPMTAPLCRPPSVFPTPTCLVRDFESFTLTIGAPGDFVGFFAPTAPLKSTPQSSVSAEYVFASRTSTGVSTNITYQNLYDAGPGANWYMTRSLASEHTNYMSAARLLAAQVKIRYIGRDDLASGIISVGSFAASTPGTTYLQVDNMIQELMAPGRVLPKEGCVVTWYPFDETDREFQPVDQGSPVNAGRLTNLAFAFYGAGLPTGAVLDFEVARIYEYVPRPNMLELLSPSTLDIPVRSKVDASLESIWNKITRLGAMPFAAYATMVSAVEDN